MIQSLGLSLGRRPAPVFKGDIHIYITWLFQYSSPRDFISIFSQHNSKRFFGFKKKTSISLFISWYQDLRFPPLISHENTAPFVSAEPFGSELRVELLAAGHQTLHKRPSPLFWGGKNYQVLERSLRQSILQSDQRGRRIFGHNPLKG